MKKERKTDHRRCGVLVLAAVFAGSGPLPVPPPARRQDHHRGGGPQGRELQTFTYHTDAEYLGEVAPGRGAGEGRPGDYGLYITEVDGEAAVYETDGAYWAFYQGGEYASQSVEPDAHQ